MTKCDCQSEVRGSLHVVRGEAGCAAHDAVWTKHARSVSRRGPRRSGFTLVEMGVVIAIMILLVGIAVPTVGPALQSSGQTQAIAMFNSSLVVAQGQAMANGTDAGLRIERAYELNKYGQMIKDGSGRAKYLDRQQIKYILNSATAEATVNGSRFPAFRQIPDSKTVELPKNTWLAPDYVFGENRYSYNDKWDIGYRDELNPDSPSAKCVNYYRSAAPAAPFSPFDTFYIIFGRDGTVTAYGRDDDINTGAGATYMGHLTCFDDKQGTKVGGDWSYPRTAMARKSARGVIVYDRKAMESLPGSDRAAQHDYLLREGRGLYINRFLGTTVEGVAR